MKELLDKISSYNLFNYLLPGILFVYFSKQFTDYNFIQDNDFIGAFLYYFIGMVISRFGSLFIDPTLKKISFLKFSDYKSFVSASKKDDKIELFSEVNNTYRTITAMFVILFPDSDIRKTDIFPGQSGLPRWRHLSDHACPIC
ncbi:MAG: hypothetical protein HGB12_12330, partial [Bacteroidetes bacterium]|nr:hypothetical protein [Bacteroidota bacterium]